MSQPLTVDGRRREIDARLESALNTTKGAVLQPAQRAVLGQENRWYGQMLALVANALTETPDDDTILQAATGIELLCGYCRLREQRLVGPERPTDDPAASQRDASLLAADYLHSMAYTTISSLGRQATPARIGVLTDVSATIVESFDRVPSGTGLSIPAYYSFVDGTAGALGRGAAVLGATLGTVDESRREQFARAGRQCSVGQRVRRDRTTEDDISELAPSQSNQTLREHERRQWAAGMGTFQELSRSIDIDSLESFFLDVIPEIETTQ